MKIKVKLFDKTGKFEYSEKGEWIDLHCCTEYYPMTPKAKRSRKDSERDVIFRSALLPLGIGMKIPKGFEAIIVPRSSTFKHFGIIQSNSVGVIDSSYSGPDDQWWYPAIDISNKCSYIKPGDRICQFRIQLSQKATIWQKLRWLFTRKIEFEFVDNYEGVNRGGFGSTGK